MAKAKWAGGRGGKEERGRETEGGMSTLRPCHHPIAHSTCICPLAEDPAQSWVSRGLRPVGLFLPKN